MRTHGKNVKKYLDIQDGICYGVDTRVSSEIQCSISPPLIVPAQDDRKYSVRMLDNLQMESHSPDFIIPMDERTPQQTHAHIFDQLLPYLHPLPGHDHCGLCHLWTRNVHSCHFLEPLFTSDRCSEHVHFNIRDRLIKKSN